MRRGYRMCLVQINVCFQIADGPKFPVSPFPSNRQQTKQNLSPVKIIGELAVALDTTATLDNGLQWLAQHSASNRPRLCLSIKIKRYIREIRLTEVQIITTCLLPVRKKNPF